MRLKRLPVLMALLLAAASVWPLPAAPQAVAAPPVVGEALPANPIQAAPLAVPELTNTIYLRVVNARTEPRAFDGAGVIVGEPITSTYQFMINEDNTGDPFDTTDCFAYTDPPTNTIRNPNYPDGCDWPGVRTNPGWSPIITEGTQDDLNETTGITLPPGRYLLSVLADGYKNDGIHFTVPLADPGLLTVQVQPHPLPPATMVIQVFHDRSMTNGQYDAPVEQGLAGFRASINDILGEVTTDIFGNPLCTEYVHDANGNVVLNPDGTPMIQTIGNGCYSDENGMITIPNIGTIRWDVLVVPPDGSNWAQTTTLEGSFGWDTWLQEAGTGLDNEFLVAGEPFPWTIFGFVAPTNTLPIDPTDTGTVRGVIMGITSYSPSQGGLPYQGTIWGGYSGVKLDAPIANPWLSLNDLQNGDTAVWVGQGNADGSFEIPNVPPGNYFLSYWDPNLHYILDWIQVTVKPNQTTDIGIRTMTNWFTKWYGTVFLDENENGRRDPGEAGVPDYLVVLKDRDNTEIDRMSISSITDVNGNYELEKGYPMTSWMILEAYSDIYRTTGITFQASNQAEETTILGAGVDVDVLPILSQWGRLDWGVKFYEPDTNGGIVGTVSYDTVRAEDDAAYAGAEPWQPGIPDLEMRLYATVKVNGVPITDTTPGPNYGAYVKGPLLNTATTETFARPKNCIPRDVDGNPVDFPSMPPWDANKDCLEGPPMGVQFGTEFATLDGNYGFTEILTDPLTGAPLPAPQPLPPDDYLVEVVIPNDPILNRPIFQVTREEDVNIYDGDDFYPTVAPPECAGPWHIVDVAGIYTDGYSLPWDPGNFSTPVDNPGYVEAGGSRFEGQAKPLCNVKLITLEDRKSIAPIFYLHTPVPIPGRWRGYIIDDLNVSVDPMELTFGEKVGLHNMPIGVYDFTGRLVYTIHSDFHGVYEVLLPSSATYNAPSPSGQLASIYYIWGNDPGQPGNLNSHYNPQYRSIGTSFEIYPGVIEPSDLAPTQNGALIWSPDSQSTLARCALEPTTPQLFAVSRPYVGPTGDRSFTITGIGFGATRGSGSVRLENKSGGPTPSISILPILSWSDRQLQALVPSGFPPGPYQLTITNGSGQSAVNTLTFHVLGTVGAVTYNPPLFEVGPTRPYATIQSAIDAAAVAGNSLVVVYPGPTTPFTNPMGIWYENPIIYSRVKLQGIGPGGVYTDGTGIAGSVLDGRAVGGDTPYAGQWLALMGDIWLNRGGWDGSPVDGDGNPTIYPGPVITVLAKDGEFNSAFPVTIDGFAIQGGDQQGFPNNLDQIGGHPIPGVPAQVSVQGGGIFVNGYGRFMRITNNVILSNGGAYAAAIRLGTPDMAVPFKDNQNDRVSIANNRILANGGTNLAGAIGVFAGAEGYDIARNDICGNFSAEYGGGISHYGYSPAGQIHHNRIYYNRSYDEGGGIMIAGELPANPTQLSPGAGRVDIYANLIQSNLSNDDGGGIRFLMAGNFMYRVYNNIVVNNVSTHEGGGISLNDAPQVRVYNNTIMKNITTATSMTSNGLPAPAGLSSAQNSALLQATLPVGSPIFSDPLLFNNIFWDNRAGWYDNGTVSGIGMEGDPNAIFYWDLGTGDGSGTMSPTHSLLQVPYGAGSPTNIVGVDPLVVQQYDTSIRVLPWRGNPNFVGIDLVAVNNPVTLMGNYHLAAGSPAINTGAASKGVQVAPNVDYAGNPRPFQRFYEIGADETSGTFPLAGILYPLAIWNGPAASPPAARPAADDLYKVYLPIIYNAGGAPWTGQLDSFAFDPASGIQVLTSGYASWNPSMFGSDQEVYFTFTAISPSATRQDLLLKVGGLTAEGLLGPDAYLINIGYDATAGRIQISTLEPGNLWVDRMILDGIALAVGDQFGARASVGGLVEVYHNGELLFTFDLAAGDTPWLFNDARGRIGLWFEAPSFAGSDAAGLTDFGGGALP